MIYNDEIVTRLSDRLRRPESPSTVPGSLPVLFFGDLPLARVATVSLNPSKREYLSAKGEELRGLNRRFETLGSLGARDRRTLDPGQCSRAISTMRGYFDPGRPVYSWFNGLARVLDGMGTPYWKRQAAHLDLVQEAIDPTWSTLSAERPEEARTLLDQDQGFLRWQIETFPLQVLVCNGRSTFDAVSRLLGAEVVRSEKVARLTWSVAMGEVGGRKVSVMGWNLPLARPTGLTSGGQVELGSLLRTELEQLGVTQS
jgi:hypothetical protein